MLGIRVKLYRIIEIKLSKRKLYPTGTGKVGETPEMHTLGCVKDNWEECWPCKLTTAGHE